MLFVFEFVFNFYWAVVSANSLAVLSFGTLHYIIVINVLKEKKFNHFTRVNAIEKMSFQSVWMAQPCCPLANASESFNNERANVDSDQNIF